MYILIDLEACDIKKYTFTEWDEVAHRHQEGEGSALENEIAIEIAEEDGREREDAGMSRGKVKNLFSIS